jgi:16S rRNA processing protein RimM
MSGPTGPRGGNRRRKNQGSDLPQLEPRYLAIGKITRAHGLRGEIVVAVLTEFPDRFAETEWVYLGNEFEAEAYQLEGYRWNKRNILLKLSGVADRTQAEQLRGQLVQVPVEEAMPLPEGSYYMYQLLGLQVITTEGEMLGPIVNILETGANDVYVVDRQGKELLLPAIADVVQSVDLAKGQMIIKIIDGLIDQA